VTSLLRLVICSPGLGPVSGVTLQESHDERCQDSDEADTRKSHELRDSFRASIP